MECLYLFAEPMGSLISNAGAEIEVSIFISFKIIHKFRNGEMLTIFRIDSATYLWVKRGKVPSKVKWKGIETDLTVGGLGWWRLGRKLEITGSSDKEWQCELLGTLFVESIECSKHPYLLRQST